ncbi:putative mitochondrial hypothetical protein [Leptomonas pyrrhocoris]|uniref:Uncharacterized protein n=1 Tax=Leptomonas pyrrhocoris TaxID=157538 RepID=A0A0M9G634_LEPPY|nr:putative mitochondrial hypothetical protein [Leptomonas pyrrhocoris]XP_015661566.1 putative mitochondrial hypothetical protein [Leptomonas pyrrhocoris]KPA83126.1 putative mitochondrial hypothetical protein [Leptomonas pyrrhocoris]KPA83127.1 putative mitochondrial hypothetical protein [Leptomonas pyrrhocoris]|eukprot:XP_015661565.1 putative mitochondrial hypothetical protein [Leptomonas pyrrhocoris]
MTHSLLHFVRRLRTFSVTASCRSHPFVWYGGVYAVFISWANYAQYKRLAPMFPNYERYLKEEGGRMLDAKRQELAEVGRYNSMVGSMRRDIAGK